MAHKTNLNKLDRKLARYKGADRSVTLTGVINPPVKNAAKTAFSAQRPRLNTALKVQSLGNVVSVPSKLGL